MSTVYRPISIAKNVQLAPSALAMAIHIFFKQKNVILNLYIFPHAWCLVEVCKCMSRFIY